MLKDTPDDAVRVSVEGFREVHEIPLEWCLAVFSAKVQADFISNNIGKATSGAHYYKVVDGSD